MIIGFWSTHHGQTATTTNLLAHAICLAIKHNLKVLMSHAQPQTRQLEHALLPKYANKASDNSLMRLADAGMLVSEAMPNYTIPLLRDAKLDLLNGHSFHLSDLHLEEWDAYENVISKANEVYDVVFIDLHSGLSKPYINKLQGLCNLIVPCINQNVLVIQSFEKWLESYPDKVKVLPCLGRYEKERRFTKKNLLKKLDSKVMLVVEDNPQLADAMNEGAVLEYFGRHLHKGRFDKTIPFFKSLSNSVDDLLAYCDQVSR